MKTYVGIFEEGEAQVVIYEPGKPQRPLPLKLDVRSHSPTGFSWGYAGSGPAQLALAILCDVTGDEKIAEKHYQHFKEEVIAGQRQEAGFTLTYHQVTRWLEIAARREWLEMKDFDDRR